MRRTFIEKAPSFTRSRFTEGPPTRFTRGFEFASLDATPGSGRSPRRSCRRRGACSSCRPCSWRRTAPVQAAHRRRRHRPRAPRQLDPPHRFLPRLADEPDPLRDARQRTPLLRYRCVAARVKGDAARRRGRPRERPARPGPVPGTPCALRGRPAQPATPVGRRARSDRGAAPNVSSSRGSSDTWIAHDGVIEAVLDRVERKGVQRDRRLIPAPGRTRRPGRPLLHVKHSSKGDGLVFGGKDSVQLL